jgi:glycolate oxidase
VVQPGAVNNDVRAAVAEHGLWYPPDPASAPWSTIGGNVATNAGGLYCLKYGVTRDYVLGLFVGSEGTLGVVTEVTLRLRPARPGRRGPSSGPSPRWSPRARPWSRSPGAG